jgi:hypothetical protein
MTSSAGLPAKSPLETRRPVTSGRLKSGAAVPSESIVDAVAAMALPHVQVRHRPGVPACEYAIRIMTQAPLVPRRSPGIVQGEPSNRVLATFTGTAPLHHARGSQFSPWVTLEIPESDASLGRSSHGAVAYAGMTSGPWDRARCPCTIRYVEAKVLVEIAAPPPRMRTDRNPGCRHFMRRAPCPENCPRATRRGSGMPEVRATR